MAVAAIQRAFDRATSEHLTRTVRFIRSVGGVAEYTVASSTGPGRYAVRVSQDGTLYSCTCKGGAHEACKHRAAVAIYRASRDGFCGRADGPEYPVQGDRGYDARKIAALFAA